VVTGALRGTDQDTTRPKVAHDWDGLWQWERDGVQMPYVSIYDYLLSKENPDADKLNDSYRALEARMRQNNCQACHAPDNQGNSAQLEFFVYPNQALAGRHDIITQLTRNEMPPRNNTLGLASGITDPAERAAAQPGARLRVHRRPGPGLGGRSRQHPRDAAHEWRLCGWPPHRVPHGSEVIDGAGTVRLHRTCRVSVRSRSASQHGDRARYLRPVSGDPHSADAHASASSHACGPSPSCGSFVSSSRISYVIYTYVKHPSRILQQSIVLSDEGSSSAIDTRSTGQVSRNWRSPNGARPAAPVSAELPQEDV
jgi:hypothetical protein